jgi:pyrrolidone-carboxylate peptidase
MPNAVRKTLMKMGLISAVLLYSAVVSAKPTVLISYFDAFHRASFNNSEKVARALESKFSGPLSPIRIKLCPLNTVFDKAYAQSEECLKKTNPYPTLFLGLGEATCDLKIESIMRNRDKTSGADNEGNHRHNTLIITEGPQYLGLRYPLAHMYCGLSSSERKQLDVSNNAGSFVCNNTAYQMSYFYPEIQYGFIHVPGNNCSNLAERTENSIRMLEKMITQGVSFLENSAARTYSLPHSTNDSRLPTTKDELQSLKKILMRADQCLYEFVSRSKAAEERRSYFGLMN